MGTVPEGEVGSRGRHAPWREGVLSGAESCGQTWTCGLTARHPRRELDQPPRADCTEGYSAAGQAEENQLT